VVGIVKLGVGFPYIASVPADFYELGVLDFVEITAALRRTHTIWSWCYPAKTHATP
jgi:hypothetical protein